MPYARLGVADRVQTTKRLTAKTDTVVMHTVVKTDFEMVEALANFTMTGVASEISIVAISRFSKSSETIAATESQTAML